MSNDNKKIQVSQEIAELSIPEIEPYVPTCKFRKGKVSKIFEKALEAVDNMDKPTSK